MTSDLTSDVTSDVAGEEQFSEIAVPDGALWCGVQPAGTESVVFVHGFSVDLAMWDDQVRALAGLATTMRYDLRGFGRSGVPHPGHDHVDDLIALLTADGAPVGTAPVVAVGLSLGANVVLALAARRPDLVRHAVLASPGLPGKQWATPRPPDLARAHARAHGVESARRFWRELDLFDSTRDRPVAYTRLEAMLDRFPAHQWREQPQTRPLPSLVETLEAITVPITIVSGEHDDPGYREIAVELAERLPRAELAAVAGAGHFVNLDEPGRFDAVLARVLEPAKGVW